MDGHTERGHEAMGVRLDPAIAGRISEHGAVLIVDAHDEPTARSYAAVARRELLNVRHPEEPDDSAIPFASQLIATPFGVGFWFDASDVDSYVGVAEQMVRAMAEGLGAIEADCLLIAVPAEEVRAHAPANDPCSLPGFRQDFPLPSSAEQIDRTGLGRLTFSSRETVDELLSFFVEALTDLGFQPGAVTHHEQPSPRCPSLLIRADVLPIQNDGQVQLITANPTGPLPNHVLTEIEKTAGMVRVVVILDPIPRV